MEIENLFKRKIEKLLTYPFEFKMGMAEILLLFYPIIVFILQEIN